MFRILIAFTLTLFITATACAAERIERIERNEQVAPGILIVGDSLSAGFGIPVEQSWPALLSRRLQAENFPHTVTNISISGETTSGGLSRLGPALDRVKPAIVVIVLGANDGLRGLPLEQMRDNLRSMIRQSQAARAKVLLVGMQLPPNYGPDYAQKFQQAFTDIARQDKVPLVPFLFAGFAERRDAFQNDGIHPTAAMQPLLLDNVWRGLKPLLRKP